MRQRVSIITGRVRRSVGRSVTQTFDDTPGVPIGLLGLVKCVLALLYEVMSVGQLVGWSVGRSVGHANV